MPQETNLNVSPYFDDFDPEKNYHKVLFKPGYPIQARELTTLQSILQNQVEQQGKHLFKEGSVVIPGKFRFDIPLPAVEIESTYLGTPVSLYFNNLLGKKLRGSLSGVLAEVVYILRAEESQRNNFTLYLKYIESGGTQLENKTFFNGETLLLDSSLTYGDLGFTVQSGEGICNTISNNSNSFGSSAIVTGGVYFARGHFINVKDQRILLDQYSSSPSYKIGFDVLESIVSADEDPSLFDNARGFSNYTAPGADRLKIELILSKKGILESSSNFIEIARIEDGNPIFRQETTQYSLIRDELARRTYDESGDYFVRPFTVYVRDSLNDRTRTDGLYYENQLTSSGDTPSDDLMIYQIGPGKAYVNGYDVEKISSTEVIIEKPRTTKSIENEVIRYDAGTSLVLNRGYGSPIVGLGTTSYVELKDSRIGVSSHSPSGNTIGVARVYDFIPETDYVNNTSRLNLRLFDIQTYTKVGLTTNITSLSTPALIRGKKSKASGYLTSNITNSRILTLYDVSGSFLENEPITINGIDDGRLINEITDYNISDIKSIYSNVGITTFNADVVLSQKTPIAPLGTKFKITQPSSGISTVSAGIDIVFINQIKSGDIVSYASTALSGDIIYNKVESVSSDGLSFTISEITSVSGVCNGALPSTSVEVNNITKVFGLSDSTNSSLMTKFRFENISNVNLQNQQILQRRTFNNVSFTNNFITLSITESDLFFASFDEDRFIITYSDGTIEPMRIDKYDLDDTGKILTFYGLSKTSGTANVITTVKNTKLNHKIKKLNKASTLVIDKSIKTSSGIGTTTLNDGLTYSNVYGTRVQDPEICLNVPDVVRVVAVLESTDTQEPVLPKIELTGFSGPSNSNQDFIIGEQIIGQTSGAVGLIVSRSLFNYLEYVYLNDTQFVSEEIITGSQSKNIATITNVFLTSSKDITQNFYLDDGQRPSFYDYGRIVKKDNTESPTRKIKVVFQNYTIDPGDTGEVITVNSYPAEGFKYDIPIYGNFRSSDFIDLRPRVSNFTSTTQSPFEFSARRFDGEGQYAKYTLCPDENIIVSYSYFLPRTDLLYLTPGGTFEVAKGVPNEIPVPPNLPTNTLDIARITIPPFLFNVKNVKVDISQHKRYRMSDISLIEDRVSRLEKYTTLTMLESKTENYSIKDAVTGLDRFKSGFFVDNFSSHLYHDLENPLFRCTIDTSSNTLRPPHYTTSLDLQLGTESISGFTNEFSSTSDQSYPINLGSTQVRKTGDLITLNYNEILYSYQELASTTENVNPYIMGYWEGSIVLRPSFENWIEEKLVTIESTVNSTYKSGVPIPGASNSLNNSDNLPVYNNTPNHNKGIPNLDWISNSKDVFNDTLLLNHYRPFSVEKNSSETTWRRNKHLGIGNRYSRKSIELISRDLVDRSLSYGFINGDSIRREYYKKFNLKNNHSNENTPSDIAEDFRRKIEPVNDKKTQIISTENTSSKISSVTNSTNNIISSISGTKVFENDELTIYESTQTTESDHTEPLNYLRSRNIEFDVSSLKPRTRFNPLFEYVDVSNYIVPKLLEIKMVSGAFTIGETVESDPHFTSAFIKFKLCTPNHKTGPHNQPLQIYTLNPYNQTQFESTYSQSSTILNVDTRSLQLTTEDFYGSVSEGMVLRGKSSGAVARITSIRLISDNTGRLIGSLFIPDPSVVGNPKWINGENTFTVIDTDSSASTQFTSSGRLDVTERNVVTTRNIIIKPRPTPTPTPTPRPTPRPTQPPIVTPTPTPTPTVTPTPIVVTPTPIVVTPTPIVVTPTPIVVTPTPIVITPTPVPPTPEPPTPPPDTPPPTPEPPSISNITARWDVGNSSSGRYTVDLVVEGTGSARIAIKLSMDDNPNVAGKAFNTPLRISGPNNDITFYWETSGNQTKDTKFTPGRYRMYTYAPPATSFGTANQRQYNLPFPKRPIFGNNGTNNQVLILRDADGNDANGSFRITNIEQLPISQIANPNFCQVDPLAQSFFVPDETGIFVTSVDVFFETKDESVPVILQLRTMIAGVPSNVVIPFSEITLDPDSVEVSADGSVATRFEFPSPVYLSGPQKQVTRFGDFERDQSSEYAIVLLSNSPNYRVFISRLGDIDISTRTRISTQPSLGSLFKSQNGTTWTPSQLEDLKYNLYRASFGTEGLVRFFNPKLSLGNKKSTVTSANSFIPLSKTIVVGLGSTGYDTTNVIQGVTLSQGSATGKLIGIGASASQAIVSNVGIGYTTGTFTNISLETETGYGRGAVATIGVTTVGIATVTITSSGIGYRIGDSVKIPKLGNLGYGGKATITSIGSSNSFIIDEVQGTFSIGISTINYINSSGATVATGAGVTISSIFEDQYNDGLHMKVLHMNHGMHSTENYVKIEQFRPTSDEINSTLLEEVLIDDTTITLQSGAGIGFTTFEGVAVSATNPGYVIIGNEVIGYTSVSGNTLVSSLILRGIDGTTVQSYEVGIPVFKYEFNGISLRRINKVHNFAQVDVTNHPIDLHSYFIKIDTGSTDFDGVGIGSNRSNNLYFKKTIQSGRAGTILSNNIQYEVLAPKINSIIPAGSDMTSRIRTFTGTSIGGNEKSFVDAGYQDLPINARLYFQSPRIICSDINEQKFITESPERRSFSMDVIMTSTDERISPVIDLIPPPSLILTSNLLNNPVGLDDVSLYSNDENVRGSTNDPHSAVYVSKPINLEIPANSIKVILSANKNETNDIRVLYKIYRPDATFDEESYELFPGYSNYKLNGVGNTVVDMSLSDGSPDFFAKESNDGRFKEYTYTIDGLPDFTAFAIKIVMAGTNQASPPLVSQLRAIATALPRI